MAKGYGKGSGYSGRETAYTWKDGTTTVSNATRYEDARREAGKGSDVGLSSAVTYSTGGPSVSSGNGFTNRVYSRSGGGGGGGYQYPQQQYQPQIIMPDYSSLFNSAFNNMQNTNNSFMQSITDMLNKRNEKSNVNTIQESNYVNDALGRKNGTGAQISSAQNSSNAISRYLAGDVFKNKIR